MNFKDKVYQLVRRIPEGKVTTYGQVGGYTKGQKSRVKKVILTHIYDVLAQKYDLVAEVKKHYSGPVELAYDGMKIKI